MAVLTEFTKEMLLRSSYGDKRVAVEIAKKRADFYQEHLHNDTCMRRYMSLIDIIKELS